MIQTSMRVPLGLWKRIKVYAACEGVTVQRILSRALEAFMETRHAA